MHLIHTLWIQMPNLCRKDTQDDFKIMKDLRPK